MSAPDVTEILARLGVLSKLLWTLLGISAAGGWWAASVQFRTVDHQVRLEKLEDREQITKAATIEITRDLSYIRTELDRQRASGK
jgi:hypothetical protein